MSTSNSLIPFGSEHLKDAGEWLADEGVFFPETLRHGRFPSQNELRQAINALGFKIEEQNDWYVTSEDDSTEIWFRGDQAKGDQPVEFWCRRGEIIALDIAQSITNLCGAFIVVHDSDGLPVLIAPDDTFPYVPSNKKQEGFFATIAHRAPAQIEHLPKASVVDTLVILSQLRQALRKTDPSKLQYELLEVMKPGLPAWVSLLTHSDTRIRHLAFELITMFRESYTQRLESLRLAIINEPVSDTKTRMINALEKLIAALWIGANIDPPTRKIVDVLHQLSDAPREASSVRLAAVLLLAKVQPGMLTLAMRTVLIDAMTHPDRYALRWCPSFYVFSQALDALEKMLINHRIEILMKALPEIDFAEDAHDAMRALLDYIFFGAIRQTGGSSLPDTAPAERVTIDEKKFRSEYRPLTGRLYPANPTRLAAGDLLPTQREVLRAVMVVDLPWMVHSNLLEKYGLPPTRAAVRAMLQESSS